MKANISEFRTCLLTVISTTSPSSLKSFTILLKIYATESNMVHPWATRQGHYFLEIWLWWALCHIHMSDTCWHFHLDRTQFTMYLLSAITFIVLKFSCISGLSAYSKYLIFYTADLHELYYVEWYRKIVWACSPFGFSEVAMSNSRCRLLKNRK